MIEAIRHFRDRVIETVDFSHDASKQTDVLLRDSLEAFGYNGFPVGFRAQLFRHGSFGVKNAEEIQNDNLKRIESRIRKNAALVPEELREDTEYLGYVFSTFTFHPYVSKLDESIQLAGDAPFEMFGEERTLARNPGENPLERLNQVAEKMRALGMIKETANRRSGLYYLTNRADPLLS